MVEKAVIVLVVLIAACIVLPMATEAVENSIWTEARIAAGHIKRQAHLFCQEKGPGWRGWKNVSIYELGFSYEDLDGYYFKHDSYSILFLGYDDFLIKVKVRPTTNGAKYFKRYLLTLDEQGQWGNIDVE